MLCEMQVFEVDQTDYYKMLFLPLTVVYGDKIAYNKIQHVISGIIMLQNKTTTIEFVLQS
jgi:hypothetical protein